MSGLTDEEREWHVCCMKPRLCKDEHFHERDVEQIVARHVAAALNDAADEIDAGFRRWDALGEVRAPHSLHTPGWLVERAYEDAARIVRARAT